MSWLRERKGFAEQWVVVLVSVSVLAPIVFFGLIASLRQRGMTGARFSAVVLIAVAVVIAVWRVPKLQARPIDDIKDRLTFEDNAGRTIAQILGGAFVIVGLYSSWRSLELNQQGQANERFDRAVAALDAKEPVQRRLAGVFGLERLGLELEDENAKATVTLNAFIRQVAPWPSARQRIPVTRNPSTAISTPRPTFVLPADVDAAFKALCVLRAFPPPRFAPYPVDLSGLDLRGALGLWGVHLGPGPGSLEMARLAGVHLEDAQLGP